MNDYIWLNELSQQFLDRDYLLPGQTLDQRVDVICNNAERILNKPGFAARFKDNVKKGWYSLSTPVWNNFGNSRGMPISCFNSHISDSMESILATQAEVGTMTKMGGGTSAYFGELRPRGSAIANNGESSGSVHFMQLFESIIQVISQGSCYIEGTEVLTDTGFKDFRDITARDKLADVDAQNNVVFTFDYTPVVNDFSGELICFRGKKTKDSVSVKVTPNHRMVVYERRMKNRKRYWPNNTVIYNAEDLKLHRDIRIPLSGWAGEGNGLTNLDRLRIAFQADGIKDGENRRVRFHFSKERKITRLISLLKSEGIAYDTYTNPDGTLNINFDFNPDVKFNLFSDWVKFDLVNGNWAEEFINELALWDGSVCHGGAVVFNSTVKSNIDIVQGLASLCNKKTRTRVRKSEGKRIDLHIIIISGPGYRGGEAVEKYTEEYTGKVYCAIVPNGRLIIRYQGRVMVCGNTRRGNFAAYLPIDHKDINEFLNIRSEGSPIQSLSFGVCVPDYWMEQMIAGDKDKRKLWAKVIEARNNKGYPYIFFTDNVNKGTVDVYKDKGLKVNASNLCSEISLPSTSEESFVCCLSSMNILYYDQWKDTDAVELLVYFLDSVMTEFIDKAKHIKFMERAVKFAENHRALGLGWLGWHSYLQSKMVAFESMQAKMLNVQVAKNIKEAAYKASDKLAQEYGEPALLRGYGRRNTTLLAIAPTKSSAFILGQVSEGIEPARSNYYIKDLQKGKYTIRNPDLEKLLISKDKNTPEVWESILKTSGSVQHLDILTQDEKDVFKTFCEISPKEIIIQAAQRQKYIDQSQSLNLMIHSSIPVKDVNALLIEAWKLGVKTLYYQIGVNAAQEFSRNILSCKSCQ